MGVPGLWDVLRPAGRMRSLTHLSVTDGFEANPDGKRGFRVGIDASIWFYHATYGREGENPELRTLFFRCTRLMGMPFLPLFVFDGPKRPEIKRGKRISGKNHWMVQGMQEIISAFGFEWRMAPGEAEAELAYLNRIGVIDAILSDDVDTFLFGAKMVVRNPSTNLSGNRAHSLKNAAGKDDGNHVMTYSSEDILTHDDIQLTQGGLILIGVLRGGDYSDGLHGCGVATAHGLAKCGYGDSLLRAARTLSRDDLEDFLAQWRRDVCAELRTNAKGHLQRKSPNLAKTIAGDADFPNVDVLLAYTNPVTSEAKGAGHRNTQVDWDKEPDLGRIAGLCEMYFEWGIKEIIIKRFRTVLWPSAVLRILRRAAIIKDRNAGVLNARSHTPDPVTPRKGGKARRAPPGTPSSMIAKHFSTLALRTPDRIRKPNDDSDDDDGEDGERLIVKIHSSRRHPSTDNVLEYRLEIAPAQLVRLCEAGVKGLRTALPPDLSDSEEDDGEDDDDEDGNGGKKGKKRGAKKAPPDPESHLRIWLPACMVEIVEPEMVDEFEGVQRMKADKKAAKGKGKGKEKASAGRQAATEGSRTRKAKLPAVSAVAEEEEESGSDSSVLPSSPKEKPVAAAVKKKKVQSRTAGGTSRAAGGTSRAAATNKTAAAAASSKITDSFVAKKTTASSSSKATKNTSSSAARVADLFRDVSPPRRRPQPMESEESSEDEDQARLIHQRRPPSLTTASTSTTSSGRATSSTALKGTSSRILDLLDSQPSARPSTSRPSQVSTPSSQLKPNTLRPFPMDFDLYPLDEPAVHDDDLFTPSVIGTVGVVGEGASSSRSSRHSSGRVRPRSSLSSNSSTDSGSSPRSMLQKSPRRSEKHSSPRSMPSENKDKAKVQRTPPRREEEEESAWDSNSDRPPSPSPLKAGQRSIAAIGTLMRSSRSGSMGAQRQEEEEGEEESDRAPSPSPVRRKALPPSPLAASRSVSIPTAARRKPAPLPADLTIISISSGSDTDSPPSPPQRKPAKSVAPLQLARARQGAGSSISATSTSARSGNAAASGVSSSAPVRKLPQRNYDQDDIIDLT